VPYPGLRRWLDPTPNFVLQTDLLGGSVDRCDGLDRRPSSKPGWTGKYTTVEQTAEGIKLTAHVDAASSHAIFDTDRVYFMRVEGDKMKVKSPGVIVPMTGAKSIVEFELVKAD
jgi:hypothetical protein